MSTAAIIFWNETQSSSIDRMLVCVDVFVYATKGIQFGGNMAKSCKADASKTQHSNSHEQKSGPISTEFCLVTRKLRETKVIRHMRPHHSSVNGATGVMY